MVMLQQRPPHWPDRSNGRHRVPSAAEQAAVFLRTSGWRMFRIVLACALVVAALLSVGATLLRGHPRTTPLPSFTETLRALPRTPAPAAAAAPTAVRPAPTEVTERALAAAQAGTTSAPPRTAPPRSTPRSTPRTPAPAAAPAAPARTSGAPAPVRTTTPRTRSTPPPAPSVAARPANTGTATAARTSAPAPARTPAPAPAPVPAPACDARPLAGTHGGVAAAGRALMARFGIPQAKVLGIGARGNASDHPGGRALDFLVDKPTGDALAAYVVAHRAELRVSYVIWQQRINLGDGWTLMPDRGSPTANHYDHVHVSFTAAAPAAAC